MAGASASAAAAAAQRAVIEAAKKRQSLANLDEGHAYPVKLESEISNEEAEGLFTYVQTKSAQLQAFTEAEIALLVQLFSVVQFQEGQTLVQRGEPGTWFGIILTGTMDVVLPTGAVIALPPGNIIGEMVIWVEDSRRQATMQGGSDGLVAIMLRSELPAMMDHAPELMIKLLRIMGSSSFVKQLDNVKRERAVKLKPGLKWNEPGGRPGNDKEGFDMLVELLELASFEKNDAQAFASITSMSHVKEGASVLEAGEPVAHILIVLTGIIVVEVDFGRDKLELGHGDHLGTIEYFGVDDFRQSSRVAVKESGIIAGIPWEPLDEIIRDDPDLTLKLYSWLGKHAMSVIARKSKDEDAQEDAGESNPIGDADAPAYDTENEGSMKASGKKQMESFWLLKMQAQEAKTTHRRELTEKREELQQKEDELDQRIQELQRAVSNHRVLYARQERKVEEKEAQRQKLEEELQEAQDLRAHETAKLEGALERAKKRELEQGELQQKLNGTIRLLSAKLAEKRTSDVARSANPDEAAQAGDEEGAAASDEELELLLLSANNLLKISEASKKGRGTRRYSVASSVAADDSFSRRREKSKTEPSRSSTASNGTGVSASIPAPSRRQSSSKAPHVGAPSSGANRDKVSPSTERVLTTDSEMQTDSAMSFGEAACQTDGAFHGHATASTAIRDGDSLMGSINSRIEDHVSEMHAVHRMARRQSLRRDSVMNVGTFGHPPASKLEALSEEEKLSRYHGGHALVGQRRASAERTILGYGARRASTAGASPPRGDRKLADDLGRPLFDLLGNPVTHDGDEEDQDAANALARPAPDSPGQTRVPCKRMVDVSVQVTWNELRQVKPSLSSRSKAIDDGGQPSTAHPSLEQFLMHPEGAAPLGRTADFSALSMPLGRALYSEGSEMAPDGTLVAACPGGTLGFESSAQNTAHSAPNTARSAGWGSLELAHEVQSEMGALLGTLLPHLQVRASWKTTAGWQPRYVAAGDQRKGRTLSRNVLAAVPAEAKAALDRALSSIAQMDPSPVGKEMISFASRSGHLGRRAMTPSSPPISRQLTPRPPPQRAPKVEVSAPTA